MKRRLRILRIIIFGKYKLLKNIHFNIWVNKVNKAIGAKIILRDTLFTIDELSEISNEDLSKKINKAQSEYYKELLEKTKK